jgi:cellulose synthase/poly-beta-1,6-N-acetylglucosamine synthase-like glycosyltransferase/CheY-like chemotaxis protein
VIRVLVADDHLAVREGLHALLAKEREMAIVGEADDGSTALELARRLKPDLIVLDDSMPGIGSLEVARTVLAELPETAVVFLARDPGMRDLALAAGATAFVSKDAPSEELLRALRASTAAVTARQQLSALRPEGRRVVELLLGSRVMTGEQVQEALAKRASGESLATTVVRLGLLGQPELADILARATDTPFVSLAPYPEISAPIDPTESRLSSPRLVDPVERDAARSVPFDVARGLGVVVTAADRGHGVVAMADPLDEVAFAEAQRHSGLELTRVTATADDIKDTLERVWNGGGSRDVIWTGNLLSKLYASVVLGVILVAGIGGFGVLFRDALAPRFAFSLFALLCGFFFFLYALKYYVTIASVILITLFGDPAKFQGRHANGNGNGHANGLKADGHTNGNGHPSGQHKEGYRTLRGEKLSEAGAVVVNDPWERMGEIRLPADRQPFVSIHLALYNEGRVVDRLLEACTSFDYENYEVIVADDSTDETVEKLKRWKEHPRVRVIHRSSRKGFKGGALQEALRRMNPHTEYVMVFDADFVPPADAIWHFLDYFGRLTKPKNGNGHNANGHANTAKGAPTNGDRLAVVQGYQWHMLNASENWVTKGVRAEFSGSYVLERAGQELFGAMKMISGSVYMIRADVLRKLGWSTSITEDWELTIRLYLAGYKVLYTPYIQAPAECVSEVRRLIKQRMRWAEGHTFNVRKYFWPILRSPNLSFQEKLEFVYYAPYYLQSVLFTVATLAWIVGVLILGQKLPMWGEVFGWSLVVSNALALPLMNLTGVLLEGSLKRDALGLLSFIGLSWILVPFQAYASVKALFEKKEGGWVRTPKSGRVTETLERFHLARLMPWELPRRKRGQSKSAGTGRVAAAAVVVLAAAGIITVGALSIRAAATSGSTSETDLAVPALLGTAVPLAILALGWLRMRRRMTALVLAFTLGLGTNVVFLAHAVPAAAVTDNTSVFTFKNSTTFHPTDIDMQQGYTPSSGTASSCPAGDTYNWTCRFASDQFSAGQTLNSGQATSDLYLSNSGPLPKFRTGSASQAGSSGTQASLTITKPTGLVDGDVLIAHIGVRGGVQASLAGPSGWTTVDRINQSTSITMGVFWHAVTTASSEPASYTFTWTGSFGAAGTMLTFVNVDNTSAVDGHGGTPDSGSTTTKIAPAVTNAYANGLQVISFVEADNLYCDYIGISPDQWTPVGGVVSSGSNRTALSTNYRLSNKTLATAGTTNAQTNPGCTATPGVAHQLTLKQASTAGLTCILDVSLDVVRDITFVDSSTATMNPGPSLVMSTPTSTAQNDVMIASMAYTQGVTVTPPSGWQPTSSFCNGTAMCLTSYYLVAGASIPSSYTWTIGTSASRAVGTISSYRYVDPTNPVETYYSSSSVSGTQHVTSSCCGTGYNNALIYAVFAVAPTTSTSTWTPPTGLTERVDTAIDASPTFYSLETTDFIKSPAGLIGALTATSSVAGVGLNKVIQLIPAAGTRLGTGTASITTVSGPTLVSTTFTTSGWTFLAGDRLQVVVVAPNDATNCGVKISYDSTTAPSKLTVATIVPEGVAGLLLLAPALPFAARWWKRRRP